MCLAKAYIIDERRDEMVAVNVTAVTVNDKTIVITTILKETRVVEASIDSIDFTNGRIMLRKLE